MNLISLLLKKLPLPWKVLCAATSAFLVYAGAVALLLLMENGFVFRPSREADRWRVPDAPTHLDDHFLQTVSGATIHARFYPCTGATRAALICHSQNANLSICWPAQDIDAWHREMKMSVLVFDYPGYGRSSGAASEQGCYQAADAAYDWLLSERRIAAGDVLIVGRSLGTAVAVDLASRREHRALVLISPFTSIPGVTQCRYPVLPAELLMRNRFDCVEKIRRCTRPVLIIHGTEDWKVPIALGRQLFRSANEPRRFIEVDGAGHGDSLLASFFPDLRAFLREHAPVAAVTRRN